MTTSDPDRDGARDADPGDSGTEMARQYDILWQEQWQRLGLTCVAFVICVIYLPPWICLFCALVSLLAETASMRMMRGLDPARNLRDHLLVLAMVFAPEVASSLPAGMIWQLEEPSAKAFVLGMIMITLIHLTTVRAIYLPDAIAGFAALGATVAISNSAYWLGRDDITGPVVSSVCAAAGLGYGVTAMNCAHP